MANTRTNAPSDHLDLLTRVFVDDWEAGWFIEEWILSTEPAHAMPWEQAEQRDQLGPILVRTVEDPLVEDPFAEPRIVCEVAFIEESTLGAKLDAWHSWVRETAARDIQPIVLSYRFDGGGRSFASLSELKVPWLPERLSLGMRIAYEGVAYPLPFSRGLQVRVDGRFEVTDILPDEELWVELRETRNGERLFLTEALLLNSSYDE